MPQKIPFANRTTFFAQILTFTVVALVLFSIQARADIKHEQTIRKEIDIEGVNLLLVQSKSGDITIVGETQRSVVSLKVIKRVKAENMEEAKKLADMMEIEVLRADGELKIETKYPKEKGLRKSIFSYILQRGPRMSMDIECKVPANIEINVRTASGDVAVSKLTAPVEVQAASGDVEVYDVEADLEISVASGDIDVKGVVGDVRLNSSSGDITTGKIYGRAEISTSSGDTEASEIGGDLELHTASGDATVDGVGSVSYEGVSGTARFLDVRGGVTASAASGDLSFMLVPDANVDYSVKTASGDIKFQFLKKMAGGFVLKAGTTTGDMSANLAITISKVGRNHISGIVRDGKSKVLLETASGDILITEPGE